MSSASQRRAPRGPRTPQQARSRRTRERILQAALAAFEELGFDEATTAEIARRAGVAVGSVYGYFEDKRAILLEIVEGTMGALVGEIAGALDPELWHEGDPRQGVRPLIETVFKTRRFQPGLQRILWERFFKDAEFRAATEAMEVRIREAIEELLRFLKTEGRTRVADPAATAFVIQISVEWTAARLVLGGAPEETVDAAVDTVTDMVSRMIFA